MSHTVRERQRILARVNRIKGQLDAFSAAVQADQEDSYQIMQLLSSCRGAMNGLMGDLIEGHIHEHIVQAENKKDASAAGEDLIDLMKSFWK